MVRTGRPRSQNPRQRAVNVRLTQDEHDALRRAADKADLTVSEYVRAAALKQAGKSV